MADIDLKSYPPPDSVEVLSYEAVLSDAKAFVISQFPEDEQTASDEGVPSQASMSALLEVEGNLVLKVLQATAYHSLQLLARVNDGVKAMTLAFATGADLENLAAFYTVTRKEGESDDALKARLLLAIDGFSTAGPVNAYKFHALSADDLVKDVSVVRGDDGEILLYVLSHEGDGTASAGLIDAVHEACNHEDVRPLSDTVTTSGATVQTYSIEADIWCYTMLDSDLVTAAAEAAVKKYAADMHRVGRDVTISGLHRALHQDGVQRVEIISPAAAIILGSSEAAYCDPENVTVTFRGVDD